MARDRSYLVSYISKLTEYCDVLVLKGCYLIGKDEIVKNVNNSNIRYFNLASPVTNADIKDDPEGFVESLNDVKINVINNVQYAPEIIEFIRSRYIRIRKSGNFEHLKIIFATCAEMPQLDDLHEYLQEKMFETKLFTSSMAELVNYNNNVLDKLYSTKIKEGLYEPFNLYDVIKESSFPNLDHYDNPVDFFDLLLNIVISENFSFLYKLNSPSKSVRLMESLSKYIGRELSHRRICDEIRLDDTTYPHYYRAILNSYLGYELTPLPENLYKHSHKDLEAWEINLDYNINNITDFKEHKSKFYFIDATFLAYVQKTTIEPKLYGDFIQFNQIFQNFIVSELVKNTSANIGSRLHYLHDEGVNFDVILTRENSNCIAFKIRSTDTYTEKDLNEFSKLKELLGEHFYRGYIIYLGNEVRQIALDVYIIPVNYLWTSVSTIFETTPSEEETIEEQPILA